MRPSYIIAAARTPVAPRWGALRNVPVHELGRTAALACLEQAGLLPDSVDELIVGNVLGPGGNPARLVALHSGFSLDVAGLTVDRQCASGLDALLIADSLIRSGRAETVLAGGVESYSLRPRCHLATADGFEDAPVEQAPFTPWPDNDPDMHEAAEALACHLGIGRERQEDWAVISHRKALVARLHHATEIVPPPGTGIGYDTYARPLSKNLCRRAPILTASITAATAAVAADAGAFCLVASEAVASSTGSKAMQIVGGVTTGSDPAMPGLAAITAGRRVLQDSKVTADELSAAEIMEAYAVQAIACVEGLGLATQIVNPGGGALARGHPIGASGAILAVRLYHELAKHRGLGLAAIPSAGGLGSAILLAS